MLLVLEAQFLALLLLNLALLSVVKMRWPDSFIGRTLAVIH